MLESCVPQLKGAVIAVVWPLGSVLKGLAGIVQEHVPLEGERVMLERRPVRIHLLTALLGCS
eukprot:6463718-Amphidinium_carterae.1